jgi:hypothetical protein
MAPPLHAENNPFDRPFRPKGQSVQNEPVAARIKRGQCNGPLLHDRVLKKATGRS